MKHRIAPILTCLTRITLVLLLTVLSQTALALVPVLISAIPPRWIIPSLVAVAA